MKELIHTGDREHRNTKELVKVPLAAIHTDEAVG